MRTKKVVADALLALTKKGRRPPLSILTCCAATFIEVFADQLIPEDVKKGLSAHGCPPSPDRSGTSEPISTTATALEHYLDAAAASTPGVLPENWLQNRPCRPPRWCQQPALRLQVRRHHHAL